MKVGDCLEVSSAFDELKVFRGDDLKLSDFISIHQPTLGEICDNGERDYYSMVYNLTSTPQSMKWQLWEMGIDYTKITPYWLFCNLLYRIYPKEKTSIIFGNLDLSKFELYQNKNGSMYLSQTLETKVENNDCTNKFFNKINNLTHHKHDKSDTIYNEVVIDEITYEIMMDYLRKSHDIIKDEKMPANNSTKMILIEDDKEEYFRNKNKPYHSQLKNLISSMVNCSGFKYNHQDVWNMKIGQFMDSVKRISKIKNSSLLLQSGYSGFGINLKDVDSKKLDWLGEL